jgi:hypothetical protein
MTTYLIDYENVHHYGIDGINNLTEDDTVIIFTGNKTNCVPIEAVMAMLHAQAKTTIQKMKKTANKYLDFQLATCLGGLVGSGKERDFVIISKDCDFKAVIDYWKYNNPNVRIELRSSISGTLDMIRCTKKDITGSGKLNNGTKKIIRELVKNEKLESDNYILIYNLFLNGDSKSVFHDWLVFLFKQEKGTHLFELLENIFEDYLASKANESLSVIQETLECDGDQ